MSRKPTRKKSSRRIKRFQHYNAGEDEELRDPVGNKQVARQLVELFEDARDIGDTQAMIEIGAEMISKEGRADSHAYSAEKMRDYRSFTMFSYTARHYKDAYDKVDPKKKLVRQIYNYGRVLRGEKPIL